MRYIRTDLDELYEIVAEEEEKVCIGYDWDYNIYIYKNRIIKQADTIEELCDAFVLFKNNKPYAIVPNKEHNAELAHDVWKDYRGAIWTDKGLKYVAKTNNKGELELL